MKKDIIFLNPVCTHNIWGGTRLNREFGYPIEGDNIGGVGESAPIPTETVLWQAEFTRE